MIALLIAGGVSMLFGLVFTPLFIRTLHAQGIGQQIREDGPEGHITKAGTPTMGGLMIVAAGVSGYVAAHVRDGAIFTWGGLLTIGAIVGAGAVGLLDDWISVRNQRSLGLNARAKMAGQLAVAVVFAVLAIEKADVNTHLSFTRWDSFGFEMGRVGWVIFAVVLIIGVSNAVNLTDGLDGLAAGSSSFAFSAFVVIAFWQFRHPEIYDVSQALDLALIAAAMMGACAGFLWWNAAPARIFMGDTGSLGIGAGLAALTLVMNVHLLLVIIGGLFVIETLSVMIQVSWFRFTGKRAFRMAPLHHHFELMNWPETTVIIRFWILAALCTAAALGLFYADFINIGGVE